MQIRFTLRCVQCMATGVLRDKQYTFGVRSLLAAEKALLIRNERPDRHVATTDATIAAVDAFCTVRWDKCLKELGRYVEK